MDKLRKGGGGWNGGGRDVDEGKAGWKVRGGGRGRGGGGGR